MTVYTFVLHFHSIFRWILLFSLFYTITAALIRWRFSSSISRFSPLASILSVYVAHIQFLLGIFLFILSPKVTFSEEMLTSPLLRFFTLEHSVMMLFAVMMITAGSITSKKAPTDKVRARRIFFWYIASLIIILAAIPWPFRIQGSNWF